MRIGQRESRIEIFAGSEGRGTLGSTKTTWSSAGVEWGGFVPAFLTLRTYGAGEVPSGTREIEFGSYSNVTARQGLQVTAGPEEGTRWRVVSVDRSSRAKTLVRVEPFQAEFA